LSARLYCKISKSSKKGSKKARKRKNNLVKYRQTNCPQIDFLSWWKFTKTRNENSAAGGAINQLK